MTRSLPKLNEAELFIDKNLREARVFVDTYQSAEGKYVQALKEAQNDALSAHPELDYGPCENFTAGWTTGALCFARKTWAAGNEYPNGLWIENLRLDWITSEAKESPMAYVWVRQSRKGGLDLDGARERIRRELPKVLSKAERRTFQHADNGYLLAWPVATKQEIFDWFLNDNVEALNSCLQEQVDVFAKMIPVLDPYLARKS
jgi:hypothetical protein